MKASVIDYPRTDIDTSIWYTDGNRVKLRPKLRDEIEDIVGSALDDLGLPAEALLDVIIYGSILTNQYNSKTDIDARIILNPTIVAEHAPGNITGDDLFDAVFEVIHGVPLGGTEHEFNATVVVMGEDTELGKAPLGKTDEDPVYSVMHDKLLKSVDPAPDTFDPDKEFESERGEIDETMAKLDELLKDARTSTIDFELIKDAVSNVQDPQPLIEKLEAKLQEIEETLGSLSEEYNKLRDDRNHSYREEAPEENRHFAPGNVRYKMLEKYKYIDLLKKLKRIFEQGVDSEDVPEIAEVLQVSSNLKRAFPYKQKSPPEIEEARPGTPDIIPPLEESPQSQERGGGSFMHFGAVCPHCGHSNPIDAKEEGSELTCAKCGKKFASEGLSINTAPSQEPEKKPYCSDVPIYAALNPDEVNNMVQTLKDLGISDAVIQDFQTRVMNPDTIKPTVSPETKNAPQAPLSPPSPGVPSAQKNEPEDKTKMLEPMKQIGRAHV